MQAQGCSLGVLGSLGSALSREQGLWETGMSHDISVLGTVLGGSFPAGLPKPTQRIPYLAGVWGVRIRALPAGPGQGSHHQHSKNEDEEPQGVGKHGLSRQELVLHGPVFPEAGKRGWECSVCS